MRPSISLLRALVPCLALTLAACGGSDAESKSPSVLIQEGDFGAAVTAIDGRLAEVEAGSEEATELVVQKVEAMAQMDEGAAEEAKDAFLAHAEAHPDAVSPRDFMDAVSQLRTYRRFVPAIEIMDAGKKRWPDNEVMDQLLGMLQKDAENDEGAANALKGLGYSSK